MPSSRRKRPCCVCGKWFRPDPRVGERQKACSSPECQRQRRSKTQRLWRRGNPAYFTERRLRERNEGDRDVEPLRVPSPLSQLPWDLAQDEIGGKASDFIGVLGKMLVTYVQDQMNTKHVDNTGESDRDLNEVGKTRDGLCQNTQPNGTGTNESRAAVRECAPAK